jgi:hypothetical protein
MQLKQLIITLQDWGVKKGQYCGTVSFTNESGEIQINVNEAVSRQILAAVAEQMVAESARLGKLMTADIINAVESTAPRLES